MIWILLVAALIVIGVLLDREIYFYEGGRFGPRVQAWLYDRWSRNYDDGKRASQAHDDALLAQPLLQALNHVSEPFLLDFATGTGRLSFALMQRAEFHGRIVALDLSQGMLEKAGAKLSPYRHRVELLRHLSLPLPFPDTTFEAVCALEVLELFPDMDEPLVEFRRVLRPGGILLASRSTEASGRTAKVKSVAELTALLERTGFEQIQIASWWKLFDRVLAVKSGSSHPVAVRDLSQVLKCAGCQSIQWLKTPTHWKCQRCGNELSVTRQEILLS